MSEEINEVYNKVDELFKIKIKTYIKGTNLNFSQILFVKDLLDGSECYNLTINEMTIAFNTTKEFYSSFLEIVSEIRASNQVEIDYYEKSKRNDLKPDAIFIYDIFETLYDVDYKYEKLENRLKKLLE